jgi:hypothetical protein
MEQQVVRRGMAQQRVSSAKARSLRTQQRARQSHHSLQLFHSSELEVLTELVTTTAN